MVDVRAPDSNIIFKSGGHQGMVKCIKVGSDESLLYTGGSDGTIKLWDIGQRSVVSTIGQPKNSRQQSQSHGHHSDSVTNIIPGLANAGENLISGGRDGSICMHDILIRRHSKILQG